MRPLRFLFAGHADSRLNGERTLAFTDDAGGLSMVQPEALASMSSVRMGRPNVLELVFLNGCSSEELGRAVHDKAGVPWVCWRTACNDEAARFFSIKFFQALNRAGTSYHDALSKLGVHSSCTLVRACCNGLAQCQSLSWPIQRVFGKCRIAVTRYGDLQRDGGRHGNAGGASAGTASTASTNH